MAIIKYFPNFFEDDLNDDILLQRPTSISETQVVQELGGYKVTLTGTFDLGGARYVQDGTLTGITVSQDGYTGISFTELKINAIDYLDAVEAEPSQYLYNLLFGADDKVLGSYQQDYLSGGGGSDVLKGYKGSDTLEGEKGNDKLYGGSGQDFLNGGSGNDYLNGGSADDYLEGKSGKDVMIGGSGRDYLNGGSGSDYLNGGKANDYLEGKSGKDVLIGGGGWDYLIGGGGADKLSGGKGDDALIGGKGADVFVFRPGGGSDTIFDFNDGVDMIDINQSFKSLEIVDEDFGARVTGDGWDVLVQGTSASDLSSHDFI